MLSMECKERWYNETKNVSSGSIFNETFVVMSWKNYDERDLFSFYWMPMDINIASNHDNMTNKRMHVMYLYHVNYFIENVTDFIEINQNCF